MKTIIIAAIATACAAAAPIEWKQSEGGNGHWYEVIGDYNNYTNRWNWSESKAMAEARGGHLATITSRAESDFIKHAVFGDKNPWPTWIGLSLNSTLNGWNWVTGEEFGFSDWNSKPQNLGEYRYVLIGNQYDQINTWGLYHGSDDAQFLVEYEIQIKAAAQSGQIILSWPANPGVSYRIEVSADGAPWHQIAEITAILNAVNYAPLLNGHAMALYRVVKL